MTNLIALDTQKLVEVISKSDGRDAEVDAVCGDA